MEWNKRKQSFNRQIKNHMSVNRVETDLLQNGYGKHECYCNFLEVLPPNSTQPGPTETFFRW